MLAQLHPDLPAAALAAHVAGAASRDAPLPSMSRVLSARVWLRDGGGGLGATPVVLRVEPAEKGPGVVLTVDGPFADATALAGALIGSHGCAVLSAPGTAPLSPPARAAVLTLATDVEVALSAHRDEGHEARLVAPSPLGLFRRWLAVGKGAES